MIFQTASDLIRCPVGRQQLVSSTGARGAKRARPLSHRVDRVFSSLFCVFSKQEEAVVPEEEEEKEEEVEVIDAAEKGTFRTSEREERNSATNLR